jgi:hypothetical protein
MENILCMSTVHKKNNHCVKRLQTMAAHFRCPSCSHFARILLITGLNFFLFVAGVFLLRNRSNKQSRQTLYEQIPTVKEEIRHYSSQ